MTEHTKEPWGVTFDDLNMAVNDDGDIVGIFDSFNSTDMERIFACVNALAGIDDPAAFMQDVRKWREALSAYQEDESGENLNNLARLDVVMAKHLKGGDA